MVLRGPQKTQGLALAGRRAGQPAHRGLGRGPALRGHGPALMAGTAAPLPAAVLVFHRLVGRLCRRVAPLAAPPLSRR